MTEKDTMQNLNLENLTQDALNAVEKPMIEPENTEKIYSDSKSNESDLQDTLGRDASQRIQEDKMEDVIDTDIADIDFGIVSEIAEIKSARIQHVPARNRSAQIVKDKLLSMKSQAQANSNNTNHRDESKNVDCNGKHGNNDQIVIDNFTELICVKFCPRYRRKELTDFK